MDIGVEEKNWLLLLLFSISVPFSFSPRREATWVGVAAVEAAEADAAVGAVAVAVADADADADAAAAAAADLVFRGGCSELDVDFLFGGAISKEGRSQSDPQVTAGRGHLLPPVWLRS